MAPMYYRGAHAALLVYDITSQESFEELSSWIEGNIYKNALIDLLKKKTTIYQSLKEI